MSRASLWKVAVRTSPEAEDALAVLLANFFGQPATSYLDAETGAVTVTVFLSQKPNWVPAQRALKQEISSLNALGLDARPGRLTLTRVPPQDWAESWKRHFKPLQIGPSLLIQPTWSRRKPRKGQSLVLLDPGLSFGTGQHPTTGFCLRQLVKRRRAGESQSFLDIGTGSGILAIAAAKLGYAPVRAFDFDPDAVRIARANARLNQVSGRIKFSKQNVMRLPRRASEKYSVICANLVSDLLLTARPQIMARLECGGLLILAGILKSEFSRIEDTYERAGLRLVSSRTEKEWRSGSFESN